MKKLEPTICASKMTYQIEAMRLLKNNKKIIVNYIEAAKTLGNFPKELDFITSFYDSKTGSSGSFFRNNEIGNYILAFTGTNTVTDAPKDLEADLYGILMGQGNHYISCFRFYKKLAIKYGVENIVLTGHSLGGNIAQRVALEFNVPFSVIYNAAPIYIKNGVDLLMDVNDDNRDLYTKRLRKYKKNVQKIQNKIVEFSGKVVHFSSEYDVLNRMMAILEEEAVYIGDRYILKDAGYHSLKSLSQSNQDIMNKVLVGEFVKIGEFATRHHPVTPVELLKMSQLATDRKLALDYFFGLFIGSEVVLNLVDNYFSDIDMGKYINYLINKISSNK